MSSNEKTSDVQCYWQKNAAHRCQMLGTMGYADERGSAWYCALHRQVVLGQPPPELAHYELFVDWILQIVRFYPDSQWNANLKEIWEKLHGRGVGVGMLDDHRSAPSDGDVPTREDLQKILSRLKPGLYGKVLRDEGDVALVRPEEKPDEKETA